MIKLSGQEWANRQARIREINEQRRAAGWVQDKWGRWIPPHTVA